jgi:hypothetical protein
MKHVGDAKQGAKAPEVILNGDLLDKSLNGLTDHYLACWEGAGNNGLINRYHEADGALDVLRGISRAILEIPSGRSQKEADTTACSMFKGSDIKEVIKSIDKTLQSDNEVYLAVFENSIASELNAVEWKIAGGAKALKQIVTMLECHKINFDKGELWSIALLESKRS